MNLVHTFVISFDGIDESRLTRGHASLKRSEIVPAVDARTRIEYTKVQSNFTIGAGAAGCLLAHRDVWSNWSNCAEGENDFALVLEDDSQMTRYGELWLDKVIAYARVNTLDTIQLGTFRGHGKMMLTKPVSIGGVVHDLKNVTESRLMNFRSPTYSKSFGWGTYAYLISKRMARWASTLPMNFEMPIDSWFKALAEVPSQRISRTRQDLWVTTGQGSRVDEIGR
jgi:GR25 family glycosyltransferase involved in LPS biosynthesis